MRRVGGGGVDYSVWNDKTLQYDYYRAQGATPLRAGVIAPTPRIPRGTDIGVAPEDAARPLPVGAMRVGAGPHARGMVAARNGGSPLGQVDGGLVNAGLLLVSAYLVYKYVYKEAK